MIRGERALAPARPFRQSFARQAGVRREFAESSS